MLTYVMIDTLVRMITATNTVRPMLLARAEYQDRRWWSAVYLSNVVIIMLKALLLKYKANKKPIDSKLRFWLLTISSIVEISTSYALVGNKRLIWIKRSAWKLSIGMYGMRVKTKIIAGNNAKKKLNASDEAFTIRSASNSEFTKKRPTSKIDLPLNPGKLWRFSHRVIGLNRRTIRVLYVS